MRRMLDAHLDQARASGARLVHCCGFDSIPSDMGVYFLQKEAEKRFSEPCQQIKMRVKAAKGGLSGGTVASMINVTKEASRDPALRKQLANPYALCPADHGFSARQPNVTAPQYDKDVNAWLAPFVMAGINTRIVHRSNALRGNAYGTHFIYDEAMITGDGFRGGAQATALTAAMGAFLAGAAIKPSRWLLERFVVPKPGEGPSPQAQQAGFYDLRFIGTTASGKTLRAKVTGDADPGYGSTAKILGEAAACLSLDIDSSAPGGFWTPASLLGDALLHRLTGNAGMAFKISD